jgi:hypothetical protein
MSKSYLSAPPSRPCGLRPLPSEAIEVTLDPDTGGEEHQVLAPPPVAKCAASLALLAKPHWFRCMNKGSPGRASHHIVCARRSGYCNRSTPARRSNFAVYHLIPIIAGSVLRVTRALRAAHDPKSCWAAPSSPTPRKSLDRYQFPKLHSGPSNPAATPLSERRTCLTDTPTGPGIRRAAYRCLRTGDNLDSTEKKRQLLAVPPFETELALVRGRWCLRSVGFGA